jgi:hypothetical protein
MSSEATRRRDRSKRCGIARETGVLKMTAPRIMLDQKGNTIIDRKNRSKELCGVVNSPTPSTVQAPFLPMLLTIIPNTAFFWLSLLSVSIPRGSKAPPLPGKRRANCSLTPDGVVCLSKVGHPSPTQRYNTAIINRDGGL